MKIKPIDEAQFKKYEGCRQIIHHSYARVFGEIDLGSKAGSFAFAWRSDLISPIVVEAGKCCWIGVDQRIVAIIVATGQIHLSMGLPTNILDIIPANEFVLAVCDSEIISISVSGLVRCSHTISDGIQRVELKGSYAEVMTLENELRNLQV